MKAWIKKKVPYDTSSWKLITMSVSKWSCISYIMFNMRISPVKREESEMIVESEMCGVENEAGLPYPGLFLVICRIYPSKWTDPTVGCLRASLQSLWLGKLLLHSHRWKDVLNKLTYIALWKVQFTIFPFTLSPRNTFSCCIRVIVMQEGLTLHKPTFVFQEHMPYFRRRMIYEIVSKQLLWRCDHMLPRTSILCSILLISCTASF